MKVGFASELLVINSNQRQARVWIHPTKSNFKSPRAVLMHAASVYVQRGFLMDASVVGLPLGI